MVSTNALRVLCANPPGGAFYHITEAWGNAFRACGFKFEKWDGTKESWKRFKPDIYLGCSGHRQSIPQDLRKDFGTRVGIHCNPYGSVRLDRVHGNDINEPQGAIKWIVANKPDFVFGYGLQEDAETYWSNYEQMHHIPWYGIPSAGDMVHYYPDPDDDFNCEIGYVGGRWAYKACNLDTYLIPALKSHKYCLFGWGGWKGFKFRPLPHGTDIDRKLFSSAKISPSVCEPHTSIYCIDWPERIFKVPLCGGFTISDRIKGFDKYLPPETFPMASDPEEYLQLIEHYLSNEQERKDLSARQHDYVLRHHTYFERIKIFLKAAGFGDKINIVEQAKRDLACRQSRF